MSAERVELEKRKIGRKNMSADSMELEQTKRWSHKHISGHHGTRKNEKMVTQTYQRTTWNSKIRNNDHKNISADNMELEKHYAPHHTTPVVSPFGHTH